MIEINQFISRKCHPPPQPPPTPMTIDSSGLLFPTQPGHLLAGLRENHSASIAPSHSFIHLSNTDVSGNYHLPGVVVIHNHRPTASFRLWAKTDLEALSSGQQRESRIVTTDPSEDERGLLLLTTPGASTVAGTQEE